MTPEFSLPQRRIHAAVSHPACRGCLLLRRAAYIVFLSAVPFGSFFVTLWLTEPQMPSANNSHAERLAAYLISNSSDLAKSTSEASLIPSQQLSGHVDAIPRIDEQKVDLAGWSADRQGTALELQRGRLRLAPTPVLAEIQVSGSADAITIEARDTPIEDILATLSRTFGMDYQSSVELDKRLYGTYVGPLSQVVTRILQGYNFVLKNNNGNISVTVVGTPISLAANSATRRLPAPAPEPRQSGVPAPTPGQSGAPAPAPVPQQSGAPAPAPVPQGLGSATTPAPEAASPAAPVVEPKL
jgi:hypothetical protein